MTCLFVTHNSGDCDGEYEDLLGITCPRVNGFTKIGCCPVTPLTHPPTGMPPTNNDPPNTNNSSPSLTSRSFKQFNMLSFFFFTLMVSGIWAQDSVPFFRNFILLTLMALAPIRVVRPGTDPSRRHYSYPTRRTY